MPSNPDQQPDPVDKSLGDQSTTGDALSSLTDLGSDLGEAIDSDLPLIDLAGQRRLGASLTFPASSVYFAQSWGDSET